MERKRKGEKGKGRREQTDNGGDGMECEGRQWKGRKGKGQRP